MDPRKFLKKSSICMLDLELAIYFHQSEAMENHLHDGLTSRVQSITFEMTPASGPSYGQITSIHLIKIKYKPAL